MTILTAELGTILPEVEEFGEDADAERKSCRVGVLKVRLAIHGLVDVASEGSRPDGGASVSGVTEIDASTVDTSPEDGSPVSDEVKDSW